MYSVTYAVSLDEFTSTLASSHAACLSLNLFSHTLVLQEEQEGISSFTVPPLWLCHLTLVILLLKMMFVFRVNCEKLHSVMLELFLSETPTTSAVCAWSFSCLMSNKIMDALEHLVINILLLFCLLWKLIRRKRERKSIRKRWRANHRLVIMMATE